MSLAISYDSDGRLALPDFTCECGCAHAKPEQDIYVKAGILEKTPDFIARRNYGAKCVLVADTNTYAAAGERVEKALLRAGYGVTVCLIRRPGLVEPDETACGEALLTIERDTDFLISVGSGVVTDITRINAARTGLPFVSVGTAPSMDGYTSTVAPLLLRGLKINKSAVCPSVIVCDLDVMRACPKAMLAGGAGDVLGKYVAKADWLIGNIINGEPYCPVCGDIVGGAVDKLVSAADDIAGGGEEGVRALVEALLLAGLTVMIVGHTRAVASIEHNIVHYWDMAALAEGRRSPSHGVAVGVATRLVWPFFQRFAEEDLSKLDIEALANSCETRPAREARMRALYGAEGGETIMRENPEDFLTPAERARRAAAAASRVDDIRRVISAMPPLSAIERVMRTLGAPMTPAELDVDDALVSRSLRCAKDYRSRYTLFKLLGECGLLEKYLCEAGY